jgi:hypothetical protein
MTAFLAQAFATLAFSRRRWEKVPEGRMRALSFRDFRCSSFWPRALARPLGTLSHALHGRGRNLQAACLRSKTQ